MRPPCPARWAGRCGCFVTCTAAAAAWADGGTGLPRGAAKLLVMVTACCPQWRPHPARHPSRSVSTPGPLRMRASAHTAVLRGLHADYRLLRAACPDAAAAAAPLDCSVVDPAALAPNALAIRRSGVAGCCRMAGGEAGSGGQRPGSHRACVSIPGCGQRARQPDARSTGRDCGLVQARRPRCTWSDAWPLCRHQLAGRGGRTQERLTLEGTAPLAAEFSGLVPASPPPATACCCTGPPCTAPARTCVCGVRRASRRDVQGPSSAAGGEGPGRGCAAIGPAAVLSGHQRRLPHRAGAAPRGQVHRRAARTAMLPLHNMGGGALAGGTSHPCGGAGGHNAAPRVPRALESSVLHVAPDGKDLPQSCPRARLLRRAADGGAAVRSGCVLVRSPSPPRVDEDRSERYLAPSTSWTCPRCLPPPAARRPAAEAEAVQCTASGSGASGCSERSATRCSRRRAWRRLRSVVVVRSGRAAGVAAHGHAAERRAGRTGAAARAATGARRELPSACALSTPHADRRGAYSSILVPHPLLGPPCSGSERRGRAAAPGPSGAACEAAGAPTTARVMGRLVSWTACP